MLKNKARHTVVLGLAAVVAVGVAGIALATPAVNFVGSPLARGKVVELRGHEGMQSFTVDTSRPLEIITQTVTIQPGGTSGWHSHPGPQFIVVKSGAITFYGLEASCSPLRINAGESWIDHEPGMAHTVTNEGSVPAELVVTSVNPVGLAPRTDVPAPWRSPAYGCTLGSPANR